MVRWATNDDREQIRALWDLRFGDPPRYMDWFFTQRFAPDYTSVSCEGDQLITSIQSFPLNMRIRGKILPCAIIAGVSTAPEFEGQGHMGRTMRFYMTGIAARGPVMIPYTPVDFAVYQSFGHYPVTRTAFAAIEHPALLAAGGTAVDADLRRDECALFACYARNSARYSGVIARSLPDLRLKFADYAADDARCAAVTSGGDVSGYCVYSIGDDEVYGEEFMADDRAAAEKLVCALCMIARDAGLPLGIKLPPDFNLALGGMETDLRPQGAMGCADVRAMLQHVCGVREYSIEVSDPVVAANNATLDLAGRPAGIKPQIKITAGHLTQLVCGYATLTDLEGDGGAVILDRTAAGEIGAIFPRQECFIVDEY